MRHFYWCIPEVCAACPVEADCLANASGRQAELPGRKPKRALPKRATSFLVIRNARGEVLLRKRPPAGIWGGLWSFPELEHPLGLTRATSVCAEEYGLEVTVGPRLSPIAHGFTHYHLDIYPIVLQTEVEQDSCTAVEDAETLWYNLATPAPVGLAAPVATLLAALPAHSAQRRIVPVCAWQPRPRRS